MRRPVIALISLSVSLLCAAVGLRVVYGPRPLTKIVSTKKHLFALLRERAREVGHVIEAADLVRIPIDEPTAAVFFPGNKYTSYYQYDPIAYSRPAPNPDPPWSAFPEHPAGGFQCVANSLGLREDGETEAEKRDLRVLVGGDSHTYGLCANAESFSNLLEGLLADELPGRDVEVLNSGAGYYNFYNYLGAFERLCYLEPDLFVVVVYGGNDFSGSMILQRYFHAREPPAMLPYRGHAGQLGRGPAEQEGNQAVYFLNNPGDEPLAVDMATAIVEELQRQCLARGIEFLVGYLPSAFRSQPELYADTLRRTCEILGVGPEALGVGERIADRWLARLAQAGIRTLDLRPAFRAAGEPLFWRSDLHLNIAGHRLVAHELLGEVAPLLSSAPRAR